MTREERAREALFAADRAWAIGGEGLPLYRLRVEAMLAFADAEAAAMRERAAECAERCGLQAVLTPGFMDGASSASTQIAAAIRALPVSEK